MIDLKIKMTSRHTRNANRRRPFWRVDRVSKRLDRLAGVYTFISVLEVMFAGCYSSVSLVSVFRGWILGLSGLDVWVVELFDIGSSSSIVQVLLVSIDRVGTEVLSFVTLCNTVSAVSGTDRV